MLRALFILIVNLLSLSRSVMRRIFQALPFVRSNKRRYVKISLPTGVQLAGPVRKLGPVTLGRAAVGSWWSFGALVRHIADDRDVEGVFFRLGNTSAGLADVRAIQNQLDVLRRAGKRIVCHLDQGMSKDYLLATGADTILMTPPGRLYTFGSRIELTFLADVFEKVGIKAQFVNLGRYKTAMHRFTRRGITEPQEVMMRQLLSGAARSTQSQIAQRRKLPPDTVQQLFLQAPVSARDARRHGFIDKLIYLDQVKKTLEDDTDCERAVEILSPTQYLQRSPAPFKWRKLRNKKPQIAVMDLHGMVMHDGMERQLPVRNAIVPKPIVRAIESLRKNDRVRAVVLHIDSPGGSALGSDIIWRAIRKLAEKKPVIASVGNVAGSGGYYIAVAAHEIIAPAESIVGSIGVIAGKVSGGELIDKLGVRIDHLDNGYPTGMMTMTSALSEGEMINLRRDIRGFYRRFLQRVSAGRNLSRRQVHRLARGRVYTGSRACTLGLVDRLGDIEDSIDRACHLAEVERKQAEVIFVDHREVGLQKLLQKGQSASVIDVDHAIYAEEPNAQGPSATSQIAAELIPESLQPYVSTALLLQEPAALALFPFFSPPKS